jgi:DUF4097 and DUF4098 domain-containing protein YvlB
MTRHTITLLALLLAVAVGAPAQQAIDETRTVDRDAVITIENIAGDITVTGWDKNEVHITGTLEEKADELRITGGGDRLHIEVEYPDNVKEFDGSPLDIMVPMGVDVEVNSVSSDIAVDKVRGDVELATVSGTITIRGEPAEVEAETVSGDLDVRVETDAASLACVSGDIEVSGVRRELECAVVSGDITVDAGRTLETLECETVSGGITVGGEIAEDAEWSLAAHSGDIVLNLTGNVNARFEIETFSGKIHDAFGHQAQRTSKYAPGSELEFTEGDGSAKVEIEAFSGDVKVRQK